MTEYAFFVGQCFFKYLFKDFVNSRAFKLTLLVSNIDLGFALCIYYDLAIERPKFKQCILTYQQYWLDNQLLFSEMYSSYPNEFQDFLEFFENYFKRVIFLYFSVDLE